MANERTGGYSGMAYDNVAMNTPTPAATLQDQIRLITGELNKPGNSPQDVAGLKRELARLGANPIPQTKAIEPEVPQGALSQIDPANPWGMNDAVGNYGAAEPQPEQPAQPQPGALTRAHAAPDMQAMLAQYMPQDNSQSKYLALAAGFGAATKTGSFGESLGNVASALQDQKVQQEKLRSQYVPLIMQQVAAQQARDEQAQYRAEAQRTEIDARKAAAAIENARKMQSDKQHLEQQAMLAKNHGELMLGIAGGNQALRADSVQTGKDHLALERQRADPMGLFGINTSGATGEQGAVLGPNSPTAGLAGEEFLSKLPPAFANQVKALATGKAKFPNGLAANSPQMQSLMFAVSQYDPEFDTTDYNKRNATAMAFAKGKQGDAVRAANQTLSHMGILSDDIDKLANFDGIATPLNSVINPLQKTFGDQRQGNFKLSVDAVSSELRKVFGASGGGSLTELNAWKDAFPMNASHEQQRSYLGKGVELLQGALGALDNQYKAGMGRTADVSSLLSPDSLATLKYVSGEGPKPSKHGAVAKPGGATGDWGAMPSQGGPTPVQSLVDKYRSK